MASPQPQPDRYDTLLNPDFTYAWDKVICMRGAYFAHVVFCYLVFFSGVFAFISRLVPAARWTHAWFGRLYIVFMLWATGTSLVIHNTGLPPATLISFVWSLGGLVVAWLLALLHSARMRRAALAEVAARGVAPGEDLAKAIAEATARAAEAKRFAARLFSLKAAHGALMFVSWINIAGRVFATRPTADFTCHTMPVYKPMPTADTPSWAATGTQAAAEGAWDRVPVHASNYDRQPWAKTGTAGWGAAMLFGPLLAAALVGAAFSWAGARRARRAWLAQGGGGAAAVAAVQVAPAVAEAGLAKKHAG